MTAGILERPAETDVRIVPAQDVISHRVALAYRRFVPPDLPVKCTCRIDGYSVDAPSTCRRWQHRSPDGAEAPTQDRRERAWDEFSDLARMIEGNGIRHKKRNRAREDRQRRDRERLPLWHGFITKQASHGPTRG